ncbi:hypothetical protein [Kocuria rosea]|uniref:hypothetical protein n=1 Tax=Kocuria rosea TaxID=1275 RepID=UPI00203DC6EE|nr:hypothetical protein [Kocuria rosea]
MVDPADWQVGEPYGGRSREEYEQLLTAKLQPQAIRATLELAGLYQMTHEMLKRAIPEEVRGFYCTGFDEAGLKYNETMYKQQVIDEARAEGWITKNNHIFTASAAWLVRHEAITKEQADRLDGIYNHRHELTHELFSFIIDPDRNFDARKFVDAVNTLKDIHRFWASIEMDIGTFEDMDEVSLDDITPLSVALLQQCIDAYLDGASEDQDSQGDEPVV